VAATGASAAGLGLGGAGAALDFSAGALAASVATGTSIERATAQDSASFMGLLPELNNTGALAGSQRLGGLGLLLCVSRLARETILSLKRRPRRAC